MYNYWFFYLFDKVMIFMKIKNGIFVGKHTNLGAHWQIVVQIEVKTALQFFKQHFPIVSKYSLVTDFGHV